MAAEEHKGGGSPSESPTKVEHSFDDLARALAEGSISRRRALKLFAGTAIAALIPSRALAQPNKVTICHKPGTPDEQTKEVPQSAVEGHQRHGDTLGPCVSPTTTTTAAPTTSTSTSTTSTSTTPMCIPAGSSSPCTANAQCCNGTICENAPVGNCVTPPGGSC